MKIENQQITSFHEDPIRQGNRLRDAQNQIRSSLPLPSEILISADPEEKEKLSVIIDTTPSGRPIIHLAHQLTSRDLRYIFPILSESQQPGRDTQQERIWQNKLYLIIRERACPSLYRYGWAVYQQVYPSAAVAKGLAILCGILEIRYKSSLPKPAQAPLISQVASPDSRHFIAQILKTIERKQMPLDHFMDYYEINSDLPLGAALIGQYFIRRQANWTIASDRQFEQVLLAAPPNLQIKLIQQLRRMNKLDPETKNKCYQVVYRNFGDPENGHPIWQKVREKDITAYQRWITAATIGSHCKKNKTKALFYLRYTEFIEQVTLLDPYTLILRFPGFFIVDDYRQPLFSLYYEQSDYENIPLILKTDEEGAETMTIPHRRVEDAFARASTAGPVGLLFDEKGLYTSASFIEFCLLQKKAASRTQLKNLPEL